MLNEAINNNGNKTYLHILNQYKLLVSRIKKAISDFLDPEVLTLLIHISSCCLINLGDG